MPGIKPRVYMLSKHMKTLKKIYYFSFLIVCVCILAHECNACGGRRYQTLLELKLQVVVSHAPCVLGTELTQLQKQCRLLTTEPLLQHTVCICSVVLYTCRLTHIHTHTHTRRFKRNQTHKWAGDVAWWQNEFEPSCVQSPGLHP